MKKGIIGAGGFGREVYYSLSDQDQLETVFFVEDKFYRKEPNVFPLSSFNPDLYSVVVAVGDPKTRERIVSELPKKTSFFTHVHPSAQILADDVQIGKGSIICAGTILTTNIKIGDHAHLNLHTSIGHDCIIGDYFTTAPGVRISGNSKIENRVYFGTNSCIREKLKICNDVTVGLNSGVISNINEPGVYIGTPAKKIK